MEFQFPKEPAPDFTGRRYGGCYSYPSIMTAKATSGAGSVEHLFWINLGILVIAALVVLMPVVLSLIFKPRRVQDQAAQTLFEIPFITWFFTHHGIGALGVLAIVLLGIDWVIDKTTIAALLGSLFGYVLASSASGHRSTSAPITPSTTGSEGSDNPNTGDST